MVGRGLGTEDRNAGQELGTASVIRGDKWVNVNRQHINGRLRSEDDNCTDTSENSNMLQAKMKPGTEVTGNVYRS